MIVNLKARMRSSAAPRSRPSVAYNSLWNLSTACWLGTDADIAAFTAAATVVAAFAEIGAIAARPPSTAALPASTQLLLHASAAGASVRSGASDEEQRVERVFSWFISFQIHLLKVDRFRTTAISRPLSNLSAYLAHYFRVTGLLYLNPLKRPLFNLHW